MAQKILLGWISVLFVITMVGDGLSTPLGQKVYWQYTGHITSVTYSTHVEDVDVSSYFDTNWLKVGDTVSLDLSYEKVAGNPSWHEDEECYLFEWSIYFNDNLYWHNEEFENPYFSCLYEDAEGYLTNIHRSEDSNIRNVYPTMIPGVNWGPRPLYGSIGLSKFGISETVYGNISSAHHSAQVSITASWETVPEPATMLLFAAGLLGLAGSRIRKKK